MYLRIDHIAVAVLSWREIQMLEHDIRQVDAPVVSNRGKEVEYVVDVIIDSISQIAVRADAAGQFTIGTGETGKCAKGFSKDCVVDVNQDDVIREAAEH